MIWNSLFPETFKKELNVEVAMVEGMEAINSMKEEVTSPENWGKY